MNEIIYRGDASQKIRLDKYLSECFSDMTRSHIQTLIKNENILVNGIKVKTGYLLNTDDKISLDIPKVHETIQKGQDIPLDIYYEDDDVIVINKPKGMVVHPAPGHTEGTLVNALIYHCKGSLSGINGLLRPGIVHRIDKDTTGLLIACKNDRAHKFISAQLSSHTMTRQYTALCYGAFSQSEITVDAPIGRSHKNRLSMAVVSSDEGRRAVTHIRVTDCFKARFDGSYEPMSLIRCMLETGRTHQIRVHLKYIGHPLAGDEVYGIKKDPLKGQGQYLHAGVLGFIHPTTKERMLFEAPLPEYFEKTLEKLRNT